MSHQIKTHKLRFVSFLSLFLEILVMIVSINLIKNRLKIFGKEVDDLRLD